MNNRTILVKTLIAALVKVMAATIAFFMTVIITRTLGAEESGLFLLGMSLLAISSVFFRLGLDNVLLRLISAEQGAGSSVDAATTGIVWSVFASVVFSVFVFVLSDSIAELLFKKKELSSVLSILVWALPVMVIFTLLSFCFQGVYRVIAATFFQNLGVSLVFIFGFLSFYFSGVALNAANASYIYSISAIFISLLALYAWHHQIKGVWKFSFINKSLWESSSKLWVVNTMCLVVEWSGVIMVGALASSSDVAYLSAAQRTAMLTSFLLLVANMVVAPRYALLWNNNNTKKIRVLAKLTSRVLITFSLPLVFVMIAFPKSVMGLFGAEFVVAGNLLAILAIGQFFNAALGSVGFLLSMSGHEKDLRNVTLIVGALTIILNYILIGYYGTTGAAIATSVGMTAQKLFALFMVRKRLGFWPVG